MKRLLIYAALVAVSVSTVNAETRNRIYQWNNTYNIGGDPTNPDTDYLSIDQVTQQVTIVLGITDETFEFEARTEELVGEEWVDDGPGDINKMEALENAGPVAITVVGHGGHTYGARNVEWLDLVNTGVYSRIEEFKIEYDLGAEGATEVDEISGLFRVWEDLLNDLEIGTTTEDADLLVGHAIANVYITGPGPHYGLLKIASLPAGEPPEEHGIDITGSLHGTLQVGHLG